MPSARCSSALWSQAGLDLSLTPHSLATSLPPISGLGAVFVAFRRCWVIQAFHHADLYPYDSQSCRKLTARLTLEGDYRSVWRARGIRITSRGDVRWQLWSMRELRLVLRYNFLMRKEEEAKNMGKRSIVIRRVHAGTITQKRRQWRSRATSLLSPGLSGSAKVP